MTSKSCEQDAVPTKLLKDILPSVISIITNIVNISLTEGLYSYQWKTAIIRPLLKKSGLELIPSNYRPVSNLSFLSKVVEKAALNQFTRHCDAHHLMPDYQSAYRRYYSCETALVKLVNDLLWNLENQNITMLTAIDLSAAFDTVDHGVLLDVLQKQFGIEGKTLKWMDEYLRPRKCKVNIGSSYSLEKPLEFSVPQGSVAGPVLYSAYASTLKYVIPESVDIYGYADDHILKTAFSAGNVDHESSSVNKLQDLMFDIKDWMDQNRLKMNSSKTEFMLFGSRQQLTKCHTGELQVVNDKIPRSQAIKYLGSWLDECLSFKTHVTKKCQAASINLQRIRLISQHLERESLESIVIGTVTSHLDYANSLLYGVPDKDIRRMQLVQNYAAKLVLGRDWKSSSSACLRELHWLPIRFRINFKIATLVFKCLNNSAPIYLQNMLAQVNSNRLRTGLRSKSEFKKLVVPFCKKKTFANRSFSVSGPTVWNSLPSDIRSSENIQTFKRKLKTHYFRLAFNIT